MFFFRVEHKSAICEFLAKYTNISIGRGPWSVPFCFTEEEQYRLAELSVNHALPFKSRDFVFDEEINKIVCNSPTDKNVKEHFVFGCERNNLINKYFPSNIRNLLRSKDFHVKIYGSDNVFVSKFQAVMDISKPFSVIGSMELV